MLKLKINVSLPQLLCIVVSAAQTGEFELFVGFSASLYFEHTNRHAACMGCGFCLSKKFVS